MKYKNCERVLLSISEPEKAAEWLEDNLEFDIHVEEGKVFAVSGNLILQLNASSILEPQKLGIVHVAINCFDIDMALKQCKGKKLKLDTNCGQPYFNPQIWGTGTKYFNIITPFGVTIEICQRLDRIEGCAKNNIRGLEHIGVLVDSVQRSLEFYAKLGFDQMCPEVINSKKGMTVRCAMVGRRDIALELFSVEPGLSFTIQSHIEGIALSGSGAIDDVVRGLNGEKFILM